MSEENILEEDPSAPAATTENILIKVNSLDELFLSFLSIIPNKNKIRVFQVIQFWSNLIHSNGESEQGCFFHELMAPGILEPSARSPSGFLWLL